MYYCWDDWREARDDRSNRQTLRLDLDCLGAGHDTSQESRGYTLTCLIIQDESDKSEESKDEPEQEEEAEEEEEEEEEMVDPKDKFEEGECTSLICSS